LLPLVLNIALPLWDGKLEKSNDHTYGEIMRASVFKHYLITIHFMRTLKLKFAKF